MFRLLIVVTLLGPQWLAAQKSVLLLNGTAHLGNGKVINNAAIGWQNGRINLVENALIAEIDESAYDTVIRVKGSHIYPSFIAPNSTLGLTEIDAVRATLDHDEVGHFNPHVRSLIAFNTDSEVMATVRSNGVLVAQVTPRGGRISGTSSIMLLHARNWEDAIVKKDDGVHINWPSMFIMHRWGPDAGNVQRNKQYTQQVEELKAFFRKAKAYADHPETPNLKLEAMRPVFNRQKTIFVHCDFAREIEDLVSLKKEIGLEKVVIVGGHDTWRLPEMLKENNIAVIVHRIHALPGREDEDIDLPFRIPALLEKAGVLFCLENSGDMEAMNTRNLPFYAGTASAYGLSPEAALKAITLNAAKILGIDQRIGSIEKGKDATLIVSEGDALDMRSNHIAHAWIMGAPVDLDNKQTQLYRKYMKMYGLKD